MAGGAVRTAAWPQRACPPPRAPLVAALSLWVKLHCTLFTDRGVCVHTRVRVCAHVCACVCACVHACVCEPALSATITVS